jgi:hypothetical protein
MRMRTTISALMPLAFLIALSAPAAADTRCELTFEMDGWSVFYKRVDGYGRIHCDDGQSRRVRIEARGGGLTFGGWHIKGRGEFSPASDIRELFGDYGTAEAHAGAGSSAYAQVVTKGNVSLALSGEGHGINLGFAFGRFTIEPVSGAAHVDDDDEEHVRHDHVEERDLEPDRDQAPR